MESRSRAWEEAEVAATAVEPWREAPRWRTGFKSSAILEEEVEKVWPAEVCA